MPEQLNNHINVDNLTIRYAQSLPAAVSGLSFYATGGSVLGVLGGNGAGKTSTLKALAGVLPASSGYITLNDYHLTNPVEADQARSRIGYCPDIGGLIKQATVREHIGLLASTRPTTTFPNDQVERLIYRMGLSGSDSIPVGGFSHGMARRLSVLLAYLASQDLLILDEPFDGVDPLGVEATLDLISDAKSRGQVVIVSTHLLELLTQASDEIIVMNQGKMLERDSALSFRGASGAAKYKQLLMSVDN